MVASPDRNYMSPQEYLEWKNAKILNMSMSMVKFSP